MISSFFSLITFCCCLQIKNKFNEQVGLKVLISNFQTFEAELKEYFCRETKIIRAGSFDRRLHRLIEFN